MNGRKTMALAVLGSGSGSNFQAILDAIRDRGILATICQEPEAQGYTAIRVVFDHLVAHAAPAKKNWLINPTIKIRQSF